MAEETSTPNHADSGPDFSSPNDPVRPISNHTPPPYWQHTRGPSYGNDSASDHLPAIILEDNTLTKPTSSSGLWARSITIDDYVIVQGRHSVGAYVVWNCKVQTLDGGPMTIRKRYSEFDQLRQKLVAAFPLSTKSSLPPLPPKSAIYKFRPKFLDRRRQGLAYFLNCVMLNPEYAGSVIVKDFIFPPEL